MKVEWKEGCLSDFAEVVMGTSPPGSSCNNSGIGIPLLNGPTEFGGSHPTPIQFTTRPVKSCLTGDILFCVRGSTTGRMNWADREYAIGRGLAAIRHRKDRHCDYFVRAAIDHGLTQLLAMATGSTFPSVSRSDIENLSVMVPPLSDQKAIACILGALEDRIELTRKTNRTLEEIAQAVFKSWFVDFDPVRARAAGQDLPLAEHITDLFPGSFEESKLGEIPKGWKVGVVGEIFEFKNGRKRPDSAGLYPVYGGNGILSSCNNYNNQDVVVIGRVGTYCGSLFLESNKCWISDNAISAKYTKSTAFCFYTLKSSRLNELRIGSGQPLLTQNILNNINAIIPRDEIIDTYDATVWPLIKKINENKIKNSILTEIHGTLLPRLVSGELRVTDAERIVGRIL